ncbi:MAG: NADH-quinone oxidoreductase subunit NuoK [Bacteroidetes bacterium]|nr:NADH-quinone oxidoreductase subunit NuoK [Bacteroidota bacterium]
MKSNSKLIPIDNYIWLSTVLFSIGVLGVLYRRNAIIIFACIELMLNAVNLLMVSFSNTLNDSRGQVFVFFIMAVAAAEVAVGLAILVMMYRKTKSVDIDILNRLKG